MGQQPGLVTSSSFFLASKALSPVRRDTQVCDKVYHYWLSIDYWFFGPSFFVSRANSPRPLQPSPQYSSSGTEVVGSTIYRTQEAQCATEKPSIEKPSRIYISHLSVSIIIDPCTLPTTNRAIIMSTSVNRVRNTCSLHSNIVSWIDKKSSHGYSETVDPIKIHDNAELHQWTMQHITVTDRNFVYVSIVASQRA